MTVRDDIPIPPEAVKAAVEAIRPLQHNPFITDSQLTRAAIHAALAAWPGRQWHEHLVVRDNGEGYALKRTGIILPTQENSNG